MWPLVALWSNHQTKTSLLQPCTVTLAASCLLPPALPCIPPSRRYLLVSVPTAHCPLLTAQCALPTVHQLLLLQGHINSVLPTPSWAARQKPDEAPRDRNHLQTASTSSPAHSSLLRNPRPIANTRSYIHSFIVVALRRVHGQKIRASPVALPANRLPPACSVSVLHRD